MPLVPIKKLIVLSVQIGGPAEALEKHINAVSNHPGLGTCDFKVAACKEPLLADSVLVKGCGFDSLSVRAVQVLIKRSSCGTSLEYAWAYMHIWISCL